MYYRNNDQFVEISQNGLMTSPLATVHDGKTGDVTSTQLYMRNDNESFWYSNIEIFPFDKDIGEIGKGDICFEDTGWGMKLSLGSIEPTAAMWEDIDWGESIIISQIGDTGEPDIAQYHPFWCMITCPPNHNATTKENISLRVEYTENAV
jgi:hypothetical protein